MVIWTMNGKLIVQTAIGHSQLPKSDRISIAFQIYREVHNETIVSIQYNKGFHWKEKYEFKTKGRTDIAMILPW